MAGIFEEFCWIKMMKVESELISLVNAARAMGVSVNDRSFKASENNRSDLVSDIGILSGEWFEFARLEDECFGFRAVPEELGVVELCSREWTVIRFDSPEENPTRHVFSLDLFSTDGPCLIKWRTRGSEACSIEFRRSFLSMPDFTADARPDAVICGANIVLYVVRGAKDDTLYRWELGRGSEFLLAGGSISLSRVSDRIDRVLVRSRYLEKNTRFLVGSDGNLTPFPLDVGVPFDYIEGFGDSIIAAVGSGQVDTVRLHRRMAGNWVTMTELSIPCSSIVEVLCRSSGSLVVVVAGSYWEVWHLEILSRHEEHVDLCSSRCIWRGVSRPRIHRRSIGDGGWYLRWGRDISVVHESGVVDRAPDCLRDEKVIRSVRVPLHETSFALGKAWLVMNSGAVPPIRWLVWVYGSYGSRADLTPDQVSTLISRGFGVASISTRMDVAMNSVSVADRKRQAILDAIEGVRLLRKASAGTPVVAISASAGCYILGCVLNLFPHLFECVIMANGVLNPAQYIGRGPLAQREATLLEWGVKPSGSSIPDYLMESSPTQHLVPFGSTSALVLVSLKDSRVNPWQSLSWVERARALGSHVDLLFDADAGHLEFGDSLWLDNIIDWIGSHINMVASPACSSARQLYGGQ